MTQGRPTPSPELDGPLAASITSPGTPPTILDGDSLRASEGPVGHDEDEPWDTMRRRLVIDRARHLLEDVIETLEELAPAPDPSLDAALRHLRSTLRRLRVL